MLDFGFYNLDCMDGMREFPDAYFDLAIVDPPYGGVTQGGYMKTNNYAHNPYNKNNYDLTLWGQAAPGPEYFRELFRVSKNQIIWGGNYFVEQIAKNSQCWVIWDKEKSEGVTYADAEIAWTSFNRAIKIFRFRWDGWLQGDMRNKEIKIHPTQKPVKLYKWLLSNFANPGDLILDTHVGSASSLIACYEMGYKYVGFELSENYYRLARSRLEIAEQQITINSILKQ